MLEELFRFEYDLRRHTRLKETILIPLVKRLDAAGPAPFEGGQQTLAALAHGLSNKEIADRHAAGLAATFAGLHDTVHRHETAVERYYKWMLDDRIALRPDLQWGIDDPSGTGETLPNAPVGMVRLHVNF